MSTTEVKKRRQKLKRSTNPDNPSPGGDPYFDNPRNLEEIDRGLEDIKAGRVIRLKDDPELMAIFSKYGL